VNTKIQSSSLTSDTKLRFSGYGECRSDLRWGLFNHRVRNRPSWKGSVGSRRRPTLETKDISVPVGTNQFDSRTLKCTYECVPDGMIGLGFVPASERSMSLVAMGYNRSNFSLYGGPRQ